MSGPVYQGKILYSINILSETWPADFQVTIENQLDSYDMYHIMLAVQLTF